MEGTYPQVNPVTTPGVVQAAPPCPEEPRCSHSPCSLSWLLTALSFQCNTKLVFTSQLLGHSPGYHTRTVDTPSPSSPWPLPSSSSSSINLHSHFFQSINSQHAWKQKPLTGVKKSKSVCALSHTWVMENKTERKDRHHNELYVTCSQHELVASLSV